MKSNLLVLIAVIIGGVLFLQIGCQQETQTSLEPKTVSIGTRPKIQFEKTVHDFGRISPRSRHSCEFKFKNTGDSLLKITDVTKTCGCTPFILDKYEYAPGESGTLKVKYIAGTRAAVAKKSIYVLSNDKSNPKVKIDIKARIIQNISFQPRQMKLLLNKENAGCPDITVSSLDKKPFAIKYFRSQANCITADFDPSKNATKFVLKPKVDMKIAENVLQGSIVIGLTHPGHDKVTIYFTTLPVYKVSPLSINILKAKPQRPALRDVYILNNYKQDFEIEEISSANKTIKVLSKEKTETGHRYILNLQITPPTPKEGQRFFTDSLFVKLKDGKELKIRCRGFYSRK